MPKMLRLNGLTEYWEGLSGRIWNVEDDCTTCDILIKKSLILVGVGVSLQEFVLNI